MDLDERIRGMLTAGDADAAATESLRRFGPPVFSYLRSLLRDEDDASDAFSLFAEKLWRALPAFRGECALRTFCYRVAWSSAQRLREDAYRTRRVRLRSKLVSRLVAEARDSSIRRREWQADRLAQLRAALDPEEQNLLALRLDQRLSWREVAEVLAGEGELPLGEPALRKRFERTKEKVAALARERGLIE